jgi:hypothetical protein
MMETIAYVVLSPVLFGWLVRRDLRKGPEKWL